MTNKLISPVTYQGGKHRIADKICDIIQPSPENVFYDLCCGSGAISIALVNRGFPASKIKMLDLGPWGIFWKAIAEKSFSLDKFKCICNSIPKDLSKVKSFIESVAKQPATDDAVYWFLLFQASAFGGKAIWLKEGRWQNCSFRSYWSPTATSSRRSPVNPMMPMPPTIIQRVEKIVEKMSGVAATNLDIMKIKPIDGVIYVDPPYRNTTGYGFDFDIMQFVAKTKLKVFVSENIPLSERSYLISTGESKGGISGNRKSKHEEWLSEFN